MKDKQADAPVAGGKPGGAPVLADFAGTWALVRRIDDRRAGQAGRFEGRAHFRPADGGLDYTEEGWLCMAGGHPLRAERRYRWRSDGALIRVDHADGRPFHAFDPLDPAAAHDCAPDSYRVVYDFARWPAWRAQWQVSGPRKDYRLVSDYRRA